MKKLKLSLLVAVLILTACSSRNKTQVEIQDYINGETKTSDNINPLLTTNLKPGKNSSSDIWQNRMDSEALDKRLIEMAKAFKEDPKTFRMPMHHDDAQRADVFRELGMYIIVGPGGDTVYIPDDLHENLNSNI